METMWAPWRMPYILGEEPPEEGCILCNRATADESKHRELGVLRQDPLAYIIQNRYPYNNGHLMVVPTRHVDSPFDLDEAEYHALHELLKVAVLALKKAMAPHGFNLGMNMGIVAGAGIHEHCHYHIVPRWNGDTSYMPILSDTKVVSEGLHQSYDKIKPFV
jgi:ATP adenylyltransferase